MNSYFPLFESWLKERVSVLRMKELLDSFDEIAGIFIPEEMIKESVFETTDISLLTSMKERIDNDPDISSKYMIRKFTMSFALEYYIKWAEDYRLSESMNIRSDDMDYQENYYADNIYFINNDNNNSYSDTRPLYAVYFNLKKIEADTWPELYVKIMSILVKENYSKIMTFNGYGDVYYKSENNSFPSSITPAGIGYNLYVNVNLSIDEIVDKIKKFITICDLDFDDLVIAYTENNTASVSDISETSAPYETIESYENDQYENSYSDDIYSDFDDFDGFDDRYEEKDYLKAVSSFDTEEEMNSISDSDEEYEDNLNDYSHQNEDTDEEHILFKTKILNSVKDGVIEFNNRCYTIKKDECSLGDLTYMLSDLVIAAEEQQISRSKEAMYIQDFEIAQSEFNAAYHNREFLHSFISDLAELRDEMNSSEISTEYKCEKPDNISFDIVEAVLSDMLGGQKTILFEAEKNNESNLLKEKIKKAGNNISLAETWIMKLASIRDTMDSIENDISIADSMKSSESHSFNYSAV